MMTTMMTPSVVVVWTCWMLTQSVWGVDIKFTPHNTDHEIYHEALHTLFNQHEQRHLHHLDMRTRLAVFDSMPRFFTVQGTRYSTEDGTLKKTGEYFEEGLYDSLGKFSRATQLYRPGNLNVTIQTFVKAYVDVPYQHFILGQEFPDGIEGSSMGDRQAVCTGFPVLSTDRSLLPGQTGFMAQGGYFLGDRNKTFGIWGNQTDMGKIISGLESGPLTLFTKGGLAALITPFEQSMAVSVQYDLHKGTTSWGIVGTMKRIPAGFRYSTGIFVSPDGIRKVWKIWGDTMKKWYGKTTAARDNAFANNYMGYWTDNGAYYYYNTETNKTYEDTMLNVVSYSKQENIPYRYLQYDSWFYYKGPKNGDVNWTAMPDVYPSGAVSLWNTFNMPVVAHNRWWSDLTTYARANNGKFNFTVEHKNKKAIPLDETFWDFLFSTSRQWGLTTYLQDWLNKEFDEMDVTVEDITVGRTWLRQMGNAAAKAGLDILYCMAPMRAALQSLEIPAVAMVRATDDHQPSNNNWKIGISSMFADGLGLSPVKDTFWTTHTQPGNPYGLTETYPELECLVATLSTGPVAPGDKIGYSNATLLKRCCTSEGEILKPSVPPFAIDDQVIQRSFKFGPLFPEGEIWTSYSDVGNFRFGIILGADFTDEYTFWPQKSFGPKFVASKVFSYRDRSSSPRWFSDSSPLVLRDCPKSNFCLFYTTPVFTIRDDEILILGELTKWVPVSPKRVTSIQLTSTELYIALKGGINEKVTFTASIGGSTVDIVCDLGSSGTAEISVMKKTCRTL